MHAMKSETFYNHPSGNDYHETKAIDMLKKRGAGRKLPDASFQVLFEVVTGMGRDEN